MRHDNLSVDDAPIKILGISELVKADYLIRVLYLKRRVIYLQIGRYLSSVINPSPRYANHVPNIRSNWVSELLFVMKV